MLNLCLELPSELVIVQSRCWIESFRVWLTPQRDRFPTREFDRWITSWYPESIAAGQDLWIVNRKVAAAQMRFYVNVDKHLPALEILEYKRKWDRSLDGLNARASVTANRAFHTTQAWVRAEAEISVVASTAATIVISAGCGFLGVFLFTRDPVLAAIVLALVLGVIVGLAFFMVVIMDWSIGPIEVIALVVFLGYSVTYSLHVAHNYSEICGDDPRLLANLRALPPANGGEEATGWRAYAPADVRLVRTRLAVMHVGGATLSSAVSTLGSSAFLLFGVMKIFAKLGGVVIAVTALSICCALVALPTTLMLIGPSPDPCYTRAVRHAVQGATGGRRQSRRSEPEAADQAARPFLVGDGDS